MITLSAYTDVNTFVPVCESPNEPPQAHKEENEHDDFAEMLAGLLNKTAEGQTSLDEQAALDKQAAFGEQAAMKIDKTDESQVSGLNGEDAATFISETNNSEEIKNGKIFAVSDSPETTEKKPAKKISGEDADFQAEEEIPLAFLSAERLINQETDEVTADGFSEDFAVEESALQADAKIAKDFPGGKNENETAAKSDFSSMLNTENAASLEQETVAASSLASANEEKSAEKFNMKDSAKDVVFDKTETEASGSLLESGGEETAELSTDAQNDSPSRLDETRGKDRRGKLSFDVRDFRTEGDKNSQSSTQTHSAELTSARVQDASPREINMELRLPDNNSVNLGQSSAQTNWDAKAAPVTNSAAMENMLARELHQNFNGDIVRHASMALHDGGAGTIRIALKPETLGNVKIHLEMSENKVTGQIIVESEEALNAFKKEIASLEQAFRESGFSSADLNLSLNSGNENTDTQEAPSFTPRMIASRYDDASEILPHHVDVFFGQRQGVVNMFA